jgi:hypothetical protein
LSNLYFRNCFGARGHRDPTASFHGASTLAERRAAQLEGAREGGVLCTTKYITITRGDGSSATRKSVNCEE